MHTNLNKSKTYSSLGDIISYEKSDDEKIASLCNKRNLTNANAQKLKHAQIEPNNAYL